MFSIIIPVYNTEAYLSRCLDSAVQQSYDDYEIICVDDGSTDGSAEILQQQALQHPRIRVIRQENHGIGHARNTGLRAAQGDYVLFLDSDDWLEPDTLQILSQHTDNNDMICFNGRRFFNQTQENEPSDAIQNEKDLTGWEYYCRHALEKRRFAFVCVVLRCYRRNFLLQNNIFFHEGIYHEDNLFTPVVCYYAHRVEVVNHILYTYCVREHSIMTSRSVIHWQNLITTANLLAEFFSDKDDIRRTVVYRAITHHYQAAFAASDRKSDKVLAALVDWDRYRRVSRTKLRHRLQYQFIRHYPPLFRLILRIISSR